MAEESSFLSTSTQSDSCYLVLRSRGANSPCFYFKHVITPLFYTSRGKKRLDKLLALSLTTNFIFSKRNRTVWHMNDQNMPIGNFYYVSLKELLIRLRKT